MRTSTAVGTTTSDFDLVEPTKETMSDEGRAKLRPKESIQRVLISSTSYFTGEFCTEDTLISHAWPAFGDRKAERQFHTEGPTSRTGFVVSFETEPRPKGIGVRMPEYGAMADYVAAAMAVLYGKRFDAHGSLENMGMFHLPSLESFGFLIDPVLPHNTRRSRIDIGLPLNLQYFDRVYPIFNVKEETSLHDAFHAAAQFYARALRAAETDPESAYLHLITAGEIVSNAHLPKDERLLDEQLEADMARIEAALADGGAVARRLRSRLFEVKRRFVDTFVGLIDAAFFDRTECTEPGWGALKASEFRATIGAAYDLRSQFVHSGARFGGWIEPNRHLSELQLGSPVVRDPAMGKILARAPTFVGLERVTRYVILKFAEAHLRIDLSLPDPA